jgi:hypothetical protein
MQDQPDSKEIKLLSDILALVLEEQVGQSASALEAIRRRAQADRVTGGALKNLFVRIHAESATREGEIAAELGPKDVDVAAERDALRGTNLQLRKDLAALRHDMAALQARQATAERRVLVAEQQMRDAATARRGAVRISFFAGAMAAAAIVGGAFTAVLVLQKPPALPPVAFDMPPALVINPGAHPAPAPSPPPLQPQMPASTGLPREEGSIAPTAHSSPATPHPIAISASTMLAIGEHVRACWLENGGLIFPAGVQADIEVQTDESGVIRGARVTSAANDPATRAFALRALRSLLDPSCATLPLPLSMLGRKQVIKFHFAP